MESGKIIDDGLTENSKRLKENLECLVETDKDGMAQETLNNRSQETSA